MTDSYFPLRWESTGDKWWYASPIDWAAANGLYDLVRELLRLDGNHLIQLTSLRRIRRLEAVWDDEDQFYGVVKARCEVARKLLQECESRKGKNSLIGGGYGGWLLYTAASAGDLGFVQQLLGRDPLLVFGEGEYGVTDVLYAAARSKNPGVFRVICDFAVSPRFSTGAGREEEEKVGDIPLAFKKEVLKRAVHAAARGGNLVVLKELLGECDDVLEYRDAHGSTILHAAAGKGQVEVVEFLVGLPDIISSTDDDGNTALHVAAFRGQSTVVEALILASPSSVSLRNKNGDTFLHMAVAGFQTPGFRRLDRQFELMKQLVNRKVFRIEDIINAKNSQGRTALHLAIVWNVHSSLIQLLLSACYINMNISDNHGLTPLDYLRQHPQSSSSDVLMRQMISAGGISGSQDYTARKALASHLRSQATCISPGSSFKLSDTKIFLHTGVRHSSASIVDHRVKISHFSTASEISLCDSTAGDNGNMQDKKPSPDTAAKRLKTMFHWPMMKKQKSERVKDKDGYLESYKKFSTEKAPIPLRQRFSKPTSPSSNKRTLAVRSNISSPINRKKLASGIVNGVLQDLPRIKIPARSSSSSFSKSSLSPYHSLDKGKGVVLEDEVVEPSYSNEVYGLDDVSPGVVCKKGSTDKRPMNQYLCFGGRGLSGRSSFSRQQVNHGKPASHLVEVSS
ncbi:hypothetical protein Dimus_013457 [Dionaea muscipula]